MIILVIFALSKFEGIPILVKIYIRIGYCIKATKGKGIHLIPVME
ncbi:MULTISPECIES: hypothetical protein [unclassified Apibacter]|nr:MULTISPECIES: hypothetical protein [unclassified Apibacter]